MPKRIKLYNYLSALGIMLHEMKPLNPTDHDQEDTGEIILQDNELTSEEKVIKTDSYNKLSDEAKELIDLVINCPEESMLVLMTPVQKRFSFRKIRSFLEVSWKSKFIADSAIKEVKEWLRQL